MAATMLEFLKTSFALYKLNYADQWPMKRLSASHAMRTTNTSRLDSSRLAGIVTVHLTKAHQATHVTSTYPANV
jgi:hypothetical protein